MSEPTGNQPFSSEIIQLPAIEVNGIASIVSHEMRKLTPTQLKDIAKVMNGRVVFVKVRAEYSPLLDTPLCSHLNCYRPVKDGLQYCGDHG